MGLLFLHSFLNGLALTFFETTANTLFLMKYNTSELPYVYMLTAFISVIVGFFYAKLEEKLSVQKLLKITMLFVLTIVLFFLVLLKFGDSKLSFMGIMVVKDMLWMFVGMEFGILSGFMFNIRQGKRLFGLLMSGEILAGVVGGFSVGVLLDYVETLNLLFISGATLIASFFLLLNILNKFSSKFVIENESEKVSQKNNASYSVLFKNRYYVLFFAVSILAFFIFYFIDYVFYFKVEEKFTNEKELASFFGMFFALLNIVNLFSSLFVSGAALSRFGVAFGLLAIPLMAFVGASSLLIAATLSAGVGFVILIVIKLLNEVLDVSILNPTFKLLYKSIAANRRMKVLAFRETIIEPITMGVAGLALLGVSMFEGLSMVYCLIIVMAVVWLILNKQLKQEYVKSLKELLTQREVFSDDLLLDGIDEKLFLSGLQSENEVEVIYCLKALVKKGYSNLEELLTILSSHDSGVVRLNALQLIANLELKRLIGVLESRLSVEKNPKVFNELLKTYAKLATFESIETIAKFIRNENPIIREGSIIALLDYTGDDGVFVAQTAINELFESNDREDKISALNILKNMKTLGFDKALEESLRSEDREIKTLAISAVGNVKIEKFLPVLLETLDENEYRNAGVMALIKFGDSILDLLIKHFNVEEALSARLGLIKIFAAIKTERSYKFLLGNVNNPLLGDAILEKLFEINYVSKDAKYTKLLLVKNVKEILLNLSALDSFNKKDYPNSYIVFEELTSKKVANLFLILGFAYPKEVLLQCRLNYKSHSKETKAYAVEVLDNIVSPEMKKIVLPVLDDISLGKKMLSYSSEFQQKKYEEDAFFRNILEDDSSYPILKISLLYEIGQNSRSEYYDITQKLCKDKNAIVRETALWTLSQFNQR